MPSRPRAPPNPFARLPTEIVLHIFAIAAFSSSETARSLSLVCTWSRTLALPQAWDTLVLRSSKTSQTRIKTAEGLRARTFPPNYGQFVRSLWINGVHDGRQLHSVFDACRSASRLALTYDHWQILVQSTYLWHGRRGDDAPGGQGCFHYPPEHLPSPCRSLTIIGSWLSFYWSGDGWKTRVGCSIFASLTHLHILNFEPRDLPMQGLPMLTHLCVPRAPPRLFDTLAGLESVEHEQLEMIVLTLELAVTPQIIALAIQEDSRFFVIQYPKRLSDAMMKWQKESCDGLTLWEEAIRLRGVLLGNTRP